MDDRDTKWYIFIGCIVTGGGWEQALNVSGIDYEELTSILLGDDGDKAIDVAVAARAAGEYFAIYKVRKDDEA